MARVSITINGYNYDIACADGEEQHILDLAEVLNVKVGELVGAIGQAGEARLLAMAGLLMADELAEAREESQRLRAEAEVARQADQTPPDQTPQPAGIDENRVAQLLEAMAARIETIADGLERA